MAAAAQQLHRLLTQVAERAAPTSGATLERKTPEGGSSHEQSSYGSHSGGHRGGDARRWGAGSHPVRAVHPHRGGARDLGPAPPRGRPAVAGGGSSRTGRSPAARL